MVGGGSRASVWDFSVGVVSETDRGNGTGRPVLVLPVPYQVNTIASGSSSSRRSGRPR